MSDDRLNDLAAEAIQATSTSLKGEAIVACAAAPEFSIVGHAPARLGQDAVLLRRSAP